MQTSTLDFVHTHRGKGVGALVLFSLVIGCTGAPADAQTYLLAGALFSVGLAIRIWAQTHLHYRLPIEMNLVDSGPFAFTRNPIYIANTMLASSLVVASGIFQMLPILLCTCALSYSLAVRFEENCLSERYGESYLRYKEKTPRWFPRWAGWREFSVSREYLLPSIKTEMYNLLFPLPLIVHAAIHYAKTQIR